MAVELSYSTGYQLPGTSYAIPDWSSYTYSAPSFSIPTIPSFTFPTLPSVQYTPQLTELLGIQTAPEYYIPTTTAYDKYDPTLVTIRTNALNLRNDLELAIFDLTYAIDEINIARQEANQVIISLSNISTDLQSKASQLTTTKQQLDTAKATLDSNVARYQSAVASLASDATKFEEARQTLEALKAQYNTAQAQYNSSALLLNEANTRLLQDQAALTAAQTAYSADRTAYDESARILEATRLALEADLQNLAISQEQYDFGLAEYQTNLRTLQDRNLALLQQQGQLDTQQRLLENATAEYRLQAGQLEQDKIALETDRRTIEEGEAEIVADEQALAEKREFLLQSSATLEQQQGQYLDELAKFNADRDALSAQSESLELLKVQIGTQAADLTGILGSNAALQAELGQAAEALRVRQQEYVTKMQELDAAFAQYSIDKSKLDQLLAAGGTAGSGTAELSASQRAYQDTLNNSASELDRVTDETKKSGLNLNNIMNTLLAMLKAGLLGVQSWLNFLKVTGQGGGGSTRPAPGGGTTRVIVDPGSNYAGLFPYMRRENSNFAYGIGLVILILMGAWAVDEAVNKGGVTRRVKIGAKKALRSVRR